MLLSQCNAASSFYPASQKIGKNKLTTRETNYNLFWEELPLVIVVLSQS